MKEKIEYRYEFANGDVVELRISRSGSASDDKNGITSEWLDVIRQIKCCLIPQIKNDFLRYAKVLQSELFAAISAHCFM